jgi:uncharacterized protein YciI
MRGHFTDTVATRRGPVLTHSLVLVRSLLLLRSLALGLTALVLAGCALAPRAPEPQLWFVFLETGKPTPPDRERVMAMQRGHIDNFKRLFEAKQLFAAGPLRDPSQHKRGIVVVRAATRDDLPALFQPDEYVREGYMTLNAQPAHARRALATEGIDPTGIEEVRIVQLMRPGRALSATDAAAEQARLAALVGEGRFGAWYTLASGPVSDVLFSRDKNDEALRALLADLPSIKAGAAVAVWGQWLGKGVLR